MRRIKAGGLPAGPRGVPVKPAVPRGASFKAAVHECAQGRRGFKLYVPSSAAAGQPGRSMPLVVMLHGCTQTPDDFAAATGMNALAEEFGLLVAYPTQPRGANGNRCWNWYRRADQGRDAGEPALIAGITRAILRDHGAADPARVYVAGLSAGGAAAAIVAAAYPDLFAAVGVHSGLPVGAAHDAASGFLAMRQGAPGSRPTVAMPAIVFHGAADTVVNPRNGRYVAARALVGFARLRKTVTKGRSPGGRDFSRTVHSTATGKPVAEHWVVEGAGHAWAGGHPAGSFADPAGPDASRAMLTFFLKHRTPQGARRSVPVPTADRTR